MLWNEKISCDSDKSLIRNFLVAVVIKDTETELDIFLIVEPSNSHFDWSSIDNTSEYATVRSVQFFRSTFEDIRELFTMTRSCIIYREYLMWKCHDHAPNKNENRKQMEKIWFMWQYL